MSMQLRRQVRRDAMRRIQVGAAGLLGVLLLVGLTNLVVDNMRKEAGLDPAAAPLSKASNAGTPETPSEPLADLGVAPAPVVDASPDVAPPAVPDLEPDPRLQKPMDRDPRAGQQTPAR